MIMTEEKLQRLKELREKGLSRKEISFELGMKIDQVKYYSSKHGFNDKTKKGMTCPSCNGNFDQKTSTQKYCSKRCTDKESQNRTRPPKGPLNLKCEKCGGDFTSIRPNKKWCSDNCSPYKPEVKIRVCKVCNKKYKGTPMGSRFCGSECAYIFNYDRYKKRRNIYNKTCLECGKHYSTTGAKSKYCTPKCGVKFNQRKAELRRRKRIISNGKVNWDISIERLMKRDKSICYLCKDKCDIKDAQTTEEGHFVVGPKYPSVDHVIPISKGGTHTWNNVKLAHHICNTFKGDELKF